MGQRSNIAVRVNGNIKLARYYQWNYGERMISRVAHFIEWVINRTEHISYPADEIFWSYGDDTERAIRILDTNFDYEDVVISSDLITEMEEYEQDNFWDFFLGSDNNDGYGLIDISKEGIKYAFLHWNTDNAEKPLDVKAYMKADGADMMTSDTEYNVMMSENIERLEKYAKLMTAEEVELFLHSPINRPRPAYIRNDGKKFAVRMGNNDWRIIEAKPNEHGEMELFISDGENPWYPKDGGTVRRIALNDGAGIPCF